jgi:hypothetical protein
MRHAIFAIIAIVLASTACGDAATPKDGKPGATAKKSQSTPAGESPAEGGDAEAEESDEAQLLAALDPKVLRATEIAASIELDPENSDDVLARSDLDREGLDALMYEIAINPELASQYRIARGLK